MSCQPLRRAVEPIVALCHFMGGFCFFPVSGTNFITSRHKMLNFTQVLTIGLSVIIFLKLYLLKYRIIFWIFLTCNFQVISALLRNTSFFSVIWLIRWLREVVLRERKNLLVHENLCSHWWRFPIAQKDAISICGLLLFLRFSAY